MSNFEEKFKQLTKTEKQEEMTKKEIIDGMQIICQLRKKIQENKQLAEAGKREITVLEGEIVDLNIQHELQEDVEKYLAMEIKRKTDLLRRESMMLDQLRDQIWQNIQKNQGGQKASIASYEKTQEFIQKCALVKEVHENEKENAKLEGEIYGLNLFVRGQEENVKSLEKFLELNH